ncbi:O-methyltransferase [Actinoplanes sp. NPDC049265]|uniref:O-methyltransferase n=1 Tax=Actinoplanes sp. NPDC049265 TaxID=3363902 RepID=UPI00371F28E7
MDAYFVETLVDEDDALVEARESGRLTTMPQAEVAPNQGKLLSLLVRMVGATRVLEFGTLAGYSTVWLARAVGEGGQVTTLELEQQNATVAEKNLERAGVLDRVQIMVGRAAESAQRLIDAETQPYDFVFIDADKPSNPAYLEASLQLSRPGTVIVIDNVVRNGAVIDASSTDDRVQGVRSVLEKIAKDGRLDATSLQTVGSKGWDGFTILRRAR